MSYTELPENDWFELFKNAMIPKSDLIEQLKLDRPDKTIDQEVDELMARIGYSVDTKWELLPNHPISKSITSWIIQNVPKAWAYSYPSTHHLYRASQNILWFVAPRGSGKTEAIKDLILQLQGTHAYLISVPARARTDIQQNAHVFRAPMDLRGYRFDYLWIDDWLDFEFTAETLQDLKVSVTKQITALTSPTVGRP